MRRLTRFSLRSLLLLVTALCLFLGYELEWIRRRRAFLHEQLTKHAPECNVYHDFRTREWESLHLTPFDMFYTDKHGPQLLWLFKERGVGLLRVAIPERDVTRNEKGVYTVSRANPTIKRAER